jgi:glutathione S-transferase
MDNEKFRLSLVHWIILLLTTFLLFNMQFLQSNRNRQNKKRNSNMKIALKYFDFALRGEALRIMLNGCPHVEFAETRIPFAEWGTVKPTMPLRQVPVLTIDHDGDVGSTDNVAAVTQTPSLYRYAAKMVDLYPTSDPFRALIVDETMDIVNDLITRLPKRAATDEELKILRHQHRDTDMKQALGLIESRIEQYSAGTNTICGIPSVADLFLMTYKNTIDQNAFPHLDGTIFRDYPRIVNVANTMMKHPMVMEYYSTKNTSA